MAFYKLFQIVHRRTDWVSLLQWARELICPEYEEKRIKKQTMQLLFFSPYLHMSM